MVACLGCAGVSPEEHVGSPGNGRVVYGNKEFLINCVNYLLDDDGFINIRSKSVSIPLLDVEKVVQSKTKWQLITIGLPVVLVIAGGVIRGYFRKRRFVT